jgi:hypothetical protein
MATSSMWARGPLTSLRLFRLCISNRLVLQLMVVIMALLSSLKVARNATTTAMEIKTADRMRDRPK